MVPVNMKTADCISCLSWKWTFVDIQHFLCQEIRVSALLHLCELSEVKASLEFFLFGNTLRVLPVHLHHELGYVRKRNTGTK